MRFVGGLVAGLVLGFGGYLGYQQYAMHQDPCLGHCGLQTVCVEGVCLQQETPGADDKRRRRRRRPRRRRRARHATTTGEQPKLRSPSARDLKPSARGPSLKGTDFVNMTKPGAPEQELSTAEVNTRFRKLDRRIVSCIDRARESWDLSSGRVTVSFRIERSGKVQKVRVAAAAALQQSGLYDCIRPLVTALSFPPTSRSLVMSYPFTLD